MFEENNVPRNAVPERAFQQQSVREEVIPQNAACGDGILQGSRNPERRRARAEGSHWLARGLLQLQAESEAQLDSVESDICQTAERATSLTEKSSEGLSPAECNAHHWRRANKFLLELAFSDRPLKVWD